ncbi:MAG: hypothetical protein GX144_10145 [Clostridiaceae bacterium]|nr:hypothetical protein [Clostridiaceae bacterium]
MGLFDIFKKKSNEKKVVSTAQETLLKQTAAIPESEKKYYQADSYYTAKSHEGTPFENEVISFEQRKKTSIPSNNGLYVPEILMLHFCKKYPNPKSGYPGYWWYKYGIRDVGSIYESLVERGFIIINDKTEKYELTNLGKSELEENAYVPYMHSHSKYTTFTIWDLNKLLGTGDKSNYLEIIEKKHTEIDNRNEASNKTFMKELKVIDPEGYRLLKSQDKQIKAVQAADEKYAEDKDLKWIINFWEEIWKDGGPKFEGSGWMFRLPDLYIKAKRYDDAMVIVQKIKKTKGSYYSNKADSYITKIEERKTKEAAKKIK